MNFSAHPCKIGFHDNQTDIQTCFNYYICIKVGEILHYIMNKCIYTLWEIVEPFSCEILCKVWIYKLLLEQKKKEVGVGWNI